MQQPPFRKALLPALCNFICRFWSQPAVIEQPINFKEISL